MRIRSCFFASRVGLLVGLTVFFTAGWAEDFDGAKSRKIMPNDLITIQVVDEAELSMETRVAPDGSITYPFLKTVEVKGKTSAEVEKIIREGLYSCCFTN